MKKKAGSKGTGSSHLRNWHVAVIVALAFITYANAFTAGFVWDDELQIVKNWEIRDIRHVGAAFSSAFWAFADPDLGGKTNFYRPVQTLTYMLAYQIGGLSPWPYHLLNLLLHILATIFLYLTCVEYGISPLASLLAASIFVTHPIHSEAVTWNAGVPDVSCAAFYFASLFFFLKFLNSGIRRYQWFAALSFLAAAFSKEMAVTLPAVAFLLMLGKGKWSVERLKTAVVSLFPLIAAGLVYLAARFAALGFLTTTHLQIEASGLDWFTLGIRVFGQYIHYSLLPYPLSAYHLIPLHLSDRILSTVLYALCIALVCIVTVLADRRIPDVGLWAVVFAVTLIPVFNFKGISLTFFAERYLYIPTLAVAIILGLILDKSGNRIKAASVVLAAVFVLLTIVRNQDWKSDEALYESVLRVNPAVAHIRNNLADIYLKRGDNARARTYLETALQYLDNRVYTQSDEEKYRAYVGLAAIAARGQNYAEAKQYLTRALEIKPRGDWAYLYLGGVIMEGDGDYATAMQHFQKAIELGPLNEVARDYMGIALFNMKRYQEAIRYFNEALAINPTYKDAETHLAMARQALGS